MSCLFCGKDIGPFRLMQDADFCSSAHRKQYQTRLSKSFNRLVSPDPKPRLAAGFIPKWPAMVGEAHVSLLPSSPCNSTHPAQVQCQWALDIPSPITSRFARTAHPRTEGAAATPLVLNAMRAVTLLPHAPVLDVAIAAEPSAEQPPRVCELWMPSLRAEVAERMIGLSVAAEPALPIALLRTLALDIAIAAEPPAEQPPQVCELWMPSLRAEAAERMIAFSVAGALDAGIAATLPAFPALAIAQPGALASLSAKTVPAHAAAMALPVPFAAPTSIQHAAALCGPRFGMEPAVEPRRQEPAPIPAACELWMPSLRAEAAERFVTMSVAEPQLRTIEPALPALPAATPLAMPDAAEWAEAAAIAANAASEPATPAVSVMVPAAALQQPGLDLVIAAEGTREKAVRARAACEEWMPLPRACEAERMVIQAFAEAPAYCFTAALPDVAPLAPSRPFVPSSEEWFTSLEAEPVESEVTAHAETVWSAGSPHQAALPSQIHAHAGMRRSAILGGRFVDVPAPGAVESMPRTPEFAPAAFQPHAVAIAPLVAAAVRAGGWKSTFHVASPAAVKPSEASRAGAWLSLVGGVGIQLPSCQINWPSPTVPAPQLRSMEFFAERVVHLPGSRWSWMSHRTEPSLPVFALKAVLPPFEEAAAPKKSAPVETKVRELPKAKLYENRPHIEFAKRIAAGLMIAGIFWLGGRSLNSNKESATTRFGAGAGVGAAADVSVATARPVRPSSTPQSGGSFGRIRQAIASRASVEMTDSFRSGMQAWGVTGKSWAQGWSHNPDGYVRPGELALFKPSSSFTDYRLEFYGQIEHKSIGWVVRAQDKQNYYAMKFNVIAAGLRPTIAMVHYPVSGGKAGHRVETPLNVMIHNNQPYHVAVDVRGHRFTASIEGEEVGSWIDDSPAAGAIGFFSEAGERARLYWMKVSKNQDFIGRFCSYISGSGDDGSNTAELWPPAMPVPPHAPARPKPQEIALAAMRDSRFVKSNSDKRIDIWNS